MRVRYCYTRDIAGLETDFGELIRERLVKVIDDQFRQRGPALGIVERRFGNARIPKQPIAAMFYEPASGREFDAASDVVARRPNRFVICKGVTAIQPEELFGNSGLGGIRQPGASVRIGRTCDHEQYGNQDT